MKHIISLLMENESGALSRVSGLFSARGYNIESLTVAPTEDETLSRMTIVTNGSDEIIEVNLDKWLITNRFKTGKGPYNVEITPNGKYLVVTIKGEGSTSIFDLTNKRIVSNIKNTTKVSHGIAISPDSKYAFISVEGIGGEPGVVDVINLESLKLISSVNVGKQAGGIAFWKISD